MTQRKHSKHFGLMLMFIVVVFVALLINSAITALAVFLLVKSGMLYVAGEAVPHSGSLIVFNALISVPIGALVSVAMVKFPLKPVRNLIDGMDALAAGDFKIRMNAGSIMRRYPAFRDVSDSFNKMAEELSGVETIRTDFISNVSHEMKTPLSVMQNYATLLQSPDLPEKKRIEYAKSIAQGSKKLADMMTNILKLNRLENQKIYPKTSRYNLGEQLCECIINYETVWEQKNIELEADIAEEIYVDGDEELLTLVWNNLLSNAFKFTDEGGKVTVILEADEEHVIVKIKDTGCGISSDVGARIFEKFYQADTARATAGNGLGLALVKRVIDILKGEIEVSSVVGEGTTFTVKLSKA